MVTKARLWPDTPTHPGEILGDELEAREQSVEEFAKRTGLETGIIQRLLSGELPITADIAWELESALGDVSARFWMSLQADYDLGMERLRRKAG